MAVLCSFFLMNIIASAADTSAYRSNISLMLHGQAIMPVSASMRGTIDEFIRDLSTDYNNKRYPFSTAEIDLAIGGDIALAYSIPNEQFGIYGGVAFNMLRTVSYYNGRYNEALMRLWSVNIGAEYYFLPHHSLLNPFIRGGLSASMINGRTLYGFGFFGSFETRVPAEGRIGFTTEAGLHCMLPGSALGIELSLAYFNANLIGKSYTTPMVKPNSDLPERSLNDAANPLNSNDKDRTIDMLLFRLGCRLWL
jgi:outer membrane protein W